MLLYSIDEAVGSNLDVVLICLSIWWVVVVEIFTHIYNLSLKKPGKKPAVMMNRLSALHSPRFSRNWFNSTDCWCTFSFLNCIFLLRLCISSLWVFEIDFTARPWKPQMATFNPGSYKSSQLENDRQHRKNPVIKFTRCISMATLSLYKK